MIIQTYRPDHYAVLHAAAHDYEGFVQEELRFRRDLAYPPYTRMVRFRIEGESAEKTEKFAGRLALTLIKLAACEGEGGAGKGVPEILGPAPGVFGKLQNRFRWQVVLKEASVRKLWRGGGWRKTSARPPACGWGWTSIRWTFTDRECKPDRFKSGSASRLRSLWVFESAGALAEAEGQPTRVAPQSVNPGFGAPGFSANGC